MAWYNEIDPFCCRVLRARITDGRLPPGEVVERDVRTIQPGEIPTTGQVHLFAGIGGFAYAARLAGLPDEFDLWTAGFPCQDISTAGQGAGLHGARSGLFFEIPRLLHGVRRRPAWLLLENVPALRTRGSRVQAELEGCGYAVWPLVVGAWAVGAPHKRDRVWIAGGGLADAGCLLHPRRTLVSRRETQGRTALDGSGEGVADTGGCRYPHLVRGTESHGTSVAPHAWPSRPGEPQYEWEAPRLLKLAVGQPVDGIPEELVQHIRSLTGWNDARAEAWWQKNQIRVQRRQNREGLKALGNSIVPQVAAVIMKWMMTHG